MIGIKSPAFCKDICYIVTMSDPNGKEAGEKFLAENKSKDRVVTLASGLQYKVLKEVG